MASESIQRIWKVVSYVPEGYVASYGQVADLAGLPNRARLAAKALGCVPDDEPLPWHRIVRSTGRIAFPTNSEYANLQRTKLIEEGVVVSGYSIKMSVYQWKPPINVLLYELNF